MENLIIITTSIITNLVTNLIMHDFFSMKYSVQNNNKKTYILFITLATMIAVLVNTLHNPNYNLILYIFIFIILNVLFHIKDWKDILINISFFIVIFLLMDTLCYFLVESTVNISGIDISNIFIINTKMILSSFMQFIVYNLLKNFLLSKKLNKLKNIDLISYILISSLSMLFAGFSVILVDKENQNLKIFLFIAIIGVIILNIYYIKTIESLSKSYELEIALHNSKENSRMIFEHYQYLEDKDKNTRLILHDIKNHLQTLENCISDKDSQEKKYLNDIKYRIEDLSPRYIIEQKILNILFLEKIEEAKKHNIKIRFFINDVTLDFIDDFDLVTIFSNLLDNAIDAVKELRDNDKIIDLYIKKKNNFIIIKESNMCMNDLKEYNDKFISTKKGHSGLGLKSIETILNKYDANMVVNIDENFIFNNIILFSL